MTVDEFLVWSADRPGRYELVNGEVEAMAPERVRHAVVKAATFAALRDAIRSAALSCQALPDGIGVRIDQARWFEPDALVYCGPRLPGDATEVPEPVVIVEVLSPGTKQVDTGEKFSGYFSLPSVKHYLVLNPLTRVATHHARQDDDLIQSRIVADGTLHLDPPGLFLDVAELFRED